MSNFYYCNDCQREVDLRTVYGANESKYKRGLFPLYQACNECGGKNWEVRSV